VDVEAEEADMAVHQIHAVPATIEEGDQAIVRISQAVADLMDEADTITAEETAGDAETEMDAEEMKEEVETYHDLLIRADHLDRLARRWAVRCRPLRRYWYQATTQQSTFP
jgi:hypothetical protein